MDPSSDEILSEECPDGRVTKFTYDSSGNITSVTDPGGNTITNTWNSFDEPLDTTNALGVTTTRTYNSHGDLISISQPVTKSLTATATYSYGNPIHPGEVTSVIAPNGAVTRYTYNSAGQVASVTTPNGAVTTYSYNADGQITSVTLPRGNLKAADASAYTTTYSYNSAGQLLSVSGPLGSTSYIYDPAGLVASVTAPDGSVTTYGYDEDGRLTSTTAAYGTSSAAVTSYSYGPRGNMISETNPLGNTTSYAYGPDGNLDTETLPNGITGSFSYNPAGEVSSISYTRGCTPQNGSPTPPGPSPATGCTTLYSRNYTYQPGGLVSSSSPGHLTPGPPSSSQNKSYTYNPLQELTSVAVNTSVSGPGGPGNGVDSYSYDSAGNLTGVVGTNASYALGYNAASELSTMSLTQTQASPGVGNDIMAQPSMNADFTYNPNGERTAESISNMAPAPLGVSTPQPPTPPSPTTPQPSVTTLLYGYDPQGQMVSYTGPMGGSLLSIGSPALGAGVGGDSGVGGVSTSSPISNMQASYGYGPLGQLITSTASTVSPGGGNVAPPAVPSGSHSTTMSWNTASSIPEAISVNGYFYLYAGGLPMEQISQNGTILYYLHNRQGSTIGLVDSSGQLVASYGYSPYGTLICEHSSAANQPVTGCTSSSDTQPPKPTPPSPPGGSSCQVPQAPNLLGSPPSTQPSPTCIADSIAVNHFLYDGQYLDTVSGLYYLRARWYDPATGQFISVDALVGITDQPYQYVGGDPVNLTDPTGLACWAALEFGLTKASRQCWKSGYKRAGHDIAHGTVGVCISGVVGWGLGGVGQVCIVESQGFKHVGFTETFGIGGQSPTGSISLGLQFSNAKLPNDLRGIFGYANGSVAVGPGAGLTAGGSGFIGESRCNRTIAGATIEGGIGADLPPPFSAGAGVSNTWVQNLW